MESGGGGGGAAMGYPDSVDSSPRSRGAESWDEPFPPSAKLRLMCSYGGRIVPRPTDKSLCYLNGETRIVVVDRQSSLAELSSRLSNSLLGGRPFVLKYQLPNEDLDSLISVTTDEDLENMIDEYDRISSSSAPSAARSSRLRLFLFPSSSKTESAPSSINSLLADSKSETWFVDALNGVMGMVGIDRGLSADAASVNCLLGLEDDSSVHSRGGAPAPTSDRADSSGKPARQGQDVHSIPDSPMLDTTSSFGSTSSAPSVSNLPPIRVRTDDRPSDLRFEDHFAHMNISAAPVPVPVGNRQDEIPKDPIFAPPSSIPPHTAMASTPNISPTENPSTRVFSSDDEKSDHGRKPPAAPQQQKPTPIDAHISDSVTRPMYYPDRSSAAVTTNINPVSDPRRELPVSDPSYRGYLMHSMQPDQLQQQQQQQHQHQHNQQQFIHPNTHYIHPTTGAVLPFSSYYQVPPHHPIQQTLQSHPFDHQVPMYYMPMRQNPPYNVAAVQPSQVDTPAATVISPAAAKPGVPVPKVPVKPELPANLYRTGATPAPSPALQQAPPAPLIQMADPAHPYAGMGYQLMHHHHPSQSAAVMANYGYEYAADPNHPPQMYYTQTTSPPAMAPQYQTVVSSAATMISDASVTPQLQPGEVKQARAL